MGTELILIHVGDGIMQQPMPGAPSMWMAYVLVDDIDTFVAKTKTLGGTVCKDKMEVPGMGWLAIIGGRSRHACIQQARDPASLLPGVRDASVRGRGGSEG